MGNITAKAVQESLEKNCSNRTNARIGKYKTTHPEQRNSRLHCEDSPVYDIVKLSRKNSLKLFSLKREQKRKKDIERGKIFKIKMLFFLIFF